MSIILATVIPTLWFDILNLLKLLIVLPTTNHSGLDTLLFSSKAMATDFLKILEVLDRVWRNSS
ncbi:MAG: hypothetical protein CMJ52_08430 [Planctomycetaceae bacterium]|nr:hypothetical protein [Planctomycetaceae bacterium]